MSLLPVAIEFPCFIQASPAKVHGALTSPRSLEHWLGAACEVSQAGGTVRWRLRFPSGDEALFRVDAADVSRGTSLVCESASVLGTSEWEGTTLEFRLEAIGEGCQLFFSHRGWRERSRCFAKWVHAWDQLINTSLVRYIEHGEGEPYYPSK